MISQSFRYKKGCNRFPNLLQPQSNIFVKQEGDAPFLYFSIPYVNPLR